MTETIVEEDNFVRALEWGEARGAHLVSASLGYTDWYSRQQLDGRTAVTTRAVNAATNRGLLCVVAAGNAGEMGIGAPADAFYAISVGAVGTADEIATFSSRGPTADFRIKPEVCARGIAANVIDPKTISMYTVNYGTSFSTRMIFLCVTNTMFSNCSRCCCNDSFSSPRFDWQTQNGS